MSLEITADTTGSVWGRSLLVFAGGGLIFEKQLRGHVWVMLAGVAATVIVLVLSQRKKKK